MINFRLAIRDFMYAYAIAVYWNIRNIKDREKCGLTSNIK